MTTHTFIFREQQLSSITRLIFMTRRTLFEIVIEARTEQIKLMKCFENLLVLN